jgi:hypothetical protein
VLSGFVKALRFSALSFVPAFIYVDISGSRLSSKESASVGASAWCYLFVFIEFAWRATVLAFVPSLCLARASQGQIVYERKVPLIS